MDINEMYKIEKIGAAILVALFLIIGGLTTYTFYTLQDKINHSTTKLGEHL